MTKRVVLVRHGDDPPDDRVVTFFRNRNIEPEIRRPFKGEALGDVDDTVACSVVYGGPFNAFDTDRHSFLNDEHRWIEQCIDRAVPLLGICQGAHSIAHTLGAYAGPREGEPYEFGYYRVEPTDVGREILPVPLYFAQSHFHEFQVPAGGELLASSDLFPQQAFRYGKTIYALQFHAEVTRTGFARWQGEDAGHFEKPGVQSRSEQDALAAAHDAAQHAWFMGFLDRLFGAAVA
jgi:GMP synthase (glutamine-hydrolysing)